MPYVPSNYETWPLTQEQKDKVLSLYATKKLGEMIPEVFKGAKPDGRTTEGRSIQAFLAEIDIKPQTTKPDPNDQLPPLTDEQKEMVERLSPRCKTTLELAQTVFNDKTIKNGSKHYRLVWEHKKAMFPETTDAEDEPVAEKVYKPPTNFQDLVRETNKWVTVTQGSTRAYTFGQLKASEERCLRALMGYIRNYDFIYTASQYEKHVDRCLFLSQFFCWAHDKPDLTQIEVSQMIMAAAERVNIAQIDRTIQRIDKIHEDIMNGGDVDENGRVRKLNQADVELINGVRTKHDASKKRLSDIMGDLEEVRSKRYDARRDRYGSVLDIIDAFAKDEDTRNRVFLQEGVLEKDEDKAEVERLSGVDELMALISGQSKEEGGA